MDITCAPKFRESPFCNILDIAIVLLNTSVQHATENEAEVIEKYLKKREEKLPYRKLNKTKRVKRRRK